MNPETNNLHALNIKAVVEAAVEAAVKAAIVAEMTCSNSSSCAAATCGTPTNTLGLIIIYVICIHILISPPSDFQH